MHYHTEKISIVSETKDDYLTEIAVLQELVIKFRNEHNTVTELKEDLQNLIERYSRLQTHEGDNNV